MMKNLLLILFIFTAFILKAQFQPTISIYPVYPDDNDTVYLIANTTFPNSSCWTVGPPAIAFLGSDIEVGQGYCYGMLTAICNRTDTFNLGVISSGTYQLTFYQLITCPDTNYLSGTGFTSFTVSPTTIVGEIKPDEDWFNVFPNPAYANQPVTFVSGKKGEAAIYNVLGKEIKSFPLNPAEKVQVLLPSGLYIYKVFIEGSETTRRLLVH